jgi:hypothetical protein
MKSLRSFEVLVSQMDIQQARTIYIQEEIKAKMDIYQEKIEAAIYSIWPESEAIKYRVQDVLSFVDQRTLDLCKELTKIEETQVDLQTTRTSIDTRTKSLLETITDTMEHLHEELGPMIQGEPQMTKTLTDTMRRGLEAKMPEVEAQAERGSAGTGADGVKPPKFDGTTSWAVFRRQFETVKEHNC